MPNPVPLLEARVKDDGVEPSLLTVCAGYEEGKWRCEDLASHLVLDWLVDFVLPPSRRNEIESTTAGRQFRRACEMMYASDNYKRRGEFGELLLHAILKQEFGTDTAVSKIFLKSGVNDTVKGFDAVHVALVPDGIELWLGEVKFYSSIRKAVSDVVRELHEHLAKDYLRTEFVLVTNMLTGDSPHADALRSLMSPSRSLDEVFRRIRVPVLLTYDSTTVGAHTAVCDEFLERLNEEARTVHGGFVAAKPPKIALHLILLPLHNKAELVKALDAKLKAGRSL